MFCSEKIPQPDGLVLSFLFNHRYLGGTPPARPESKAPTAAHCLEPSVGRCIGYMHRPIGLHRHKVSEQSQRFTEVRWQQSLVWVANE